MYNVLLVDDERIILEGIASVVEWDKHGTRLAGKAVDGREAQQMIEHNPPDIVITDIRMPEMTGIELIAWAKDKYPGIVFIILSGHEEFSSAQTAMKFGVRHYLLKPCSEQQIMQVLGEAVAELNERASKEAFLASTRESLTRVLPQIQAQFLKECMTNKTYGQKEWDYYGHLLGLDITGLQVRLLLFDLDGKDYDFEHLFALHNISDELVKERGLTILLNTTIGDRLVLLVEKGTQEQWLEVLAAIKAMYKRYFRMELTVAVSSPGTIPRLRRLYKETRECLSHRFYVGEGSIITPEDIHHDEEDLLEEGADNDLDAVLDRDAFALAVRSGNREQVQHMIKTVFTRLKSSKMPVGFIKSYVLELHLILLRQAESGQAAGPLIMEPDLLQIEALGTLEQAEEVLLRAAGEITKRYYDTNMQSQCRVIEQVIRYVHDHLHDESLSLSKLSQEIVYLNVDYLGKLFRKETGEKFSNYVIQMRIEEAKRLIDAAERVKIIDIAAKVGFPNNPQYFSQVFKKVTGLTPSEYKRRQE
ncbi:DNA-binding response regulator [Paenibacillus sambharensis]|uniref:DNA-binding response regulator n=1 Tax=Paenibacillus sambharensis TaxID=1803190 RepID=A0A2W1L1W4_9BACL|nr:response regulator [Paenibacillus sambharensis]PZD93043.1 DNA-binding response regulator [Paenibacillus sambharensis]